jgi:transposase
MSAAITHISGGVLMSLKPMPIPPVPPETARVERAAFRKGNLSLKLRDELDTLVQDSDFVPLFVN